MKKKALLLILGLGMGLSSVGSMASNSAACEDRYQECMNYAAYATETDHERMIAEIYCGMDYDECIN